MIDLIKLRSQGDPWCVAFNLGGASDTDIVIPKAFRKDGAVPIAGDQFEERYQIIVMGFAYTYITGAAARGFNIEGVTDDSTVVLWEELSDAVGRVHAAVDECYIPLQDASSDSPGLDPGTLRVNIVGTAPTSGTLLIWGVHQVSQGLRVFNGAAIDYT